MEIDAERIEVALISDMRLTDHFRLREFLTSRDHPELAAMMRPTPLHINNIHLQCATIYEPVRAYLGVRIFMSSGLRSEALNEAVGGHPKSLHRFGKAGDPFPELPELLVPMFEYIRDGLAFAWSQLILYRNKGVLHVALPHPRREKLCEVRD